MISARDLSRLPDPGRLRRVMQAMAVLDAVLCPEWELRYYSFDAAWAAGEQVGSMRNGSGDFLFAHFGPAGAWVKGFAHEYPMTPYRETPPRAWPGVLDAVPSEFAGCLEEPAFSPGDATFCVWRRPADTAWQVGPVSFPPHQPDPDGSEWLLSAFDGRPETYRDWAEDYYEREVDLAAVGHVFRHAPLTPEVVRRLNPDRTLGDLTADLSEIGYAQ